MRLDEGQVVVTGAARGIGRHVALRLVAHGAAVAAGDVDEAGLASLVAEASGEPGRLVARRLDVADEADVDVWVGWAHGALGGLNALVNNAGILRDGLLVRKCRETGVVSALSRADWQAVIDVNLGGATWVARAVASRMVEDGARGVIVNMSSIARHGNRGQSAYSAAKAALSADTRTWALELARYGIRVGAVAPGLIETPLSHEMNAKARERLIAAIPVGRIGVPEDVWLAARFILECGYFTGQTIDVDGGLSV